MPAYVSGEVEADEAANIVVAVDGVIGGWGRASIHKYPSKEDTDLAGVDPPPEGSERVRTFSALIPPSLLHDGDNDVRLYALERAEGGVRLRPARSP